MHLDVLGDMGFGGGREKKHWGEDVGVFLMGFLMGRGAMVAQ